MIDYSTPMSIAPEQWLTVAARDNEGRDSLAPQDPLEEVVTMIYRVKGSDLMAYRAGRIDRDEVRKRVQVQSPILRSEFLRLGVLEYPYGPVSSRVRPRLSAILFAADVLDQLRRVSGRRRLARADRRHHRLVRRRDYRGRQEQARAQRLAEAAQQDGRSRQGVQINAIFRRVGEQEMWGEHFGWAIPRTSRLRAGAETNDDRAALARSATPASSRACRCCRTASSSTPRSRSTLKKGSQVLAKLGEFPIERQLLTQ